jgi:histidinol phosphatase-like enzyme (inositol monophosphatase family)
MTPEELDLALEVACRASDLARAEIMPRFRDVAVEWKGDGSPVTEADRAAERVIRGVLEEAYPELSLLGEEYGGDDRPAGTAGWIVDPIDGTISFARGIPLFGTLIALVDDAGSQLGLIDLPALGERFTGRAGGGCLRDGQPVQCSTQTDLRRSIVSHGDPICFEWAGAMPALERLMHEVPLLRGYTDAFGHAQVLSGGVDLMIDCDLNPWDAAATEILVREAGGACMRRDRDGGKIDLVFGSTALVDQVAGWL